MFRILKRNDQLLNQFEIIEKENTNPSICTKDGGLHNLQTEHHTPSGRDDLENAFDSLLVF
jgi:hypothetical protein